MSEHFSLWQERCLKNTHAAEQARMMVHAFAQQEESFLALCRVPQSAPYHAEGREVRDHLLRALTFLFAVQYPEHAIQEVDEWQSAKHLIGFFSRLQETLVKEKDFLQAYILAHDIGKKDTAEEDANGWHYPLHAERGAESIYATFREKALRFSGCTASEGKFLRELIRIHMQVIQEITRKKDTKILKAAAVIANKQGINTARFLTLLPAAFFLDVIVGSTYKEENGFEKAKLLMVYAEHEYEMFPERKEEDALRIQRQKKEARKKLLEAQGLSPEEWFVRLNVPYGKERGVVVKILDRFIRGVETEEDIRYVGKEHADELRMRRAGAESLR